MMPNIDLFECTDEIHHMEDSLFNDGLIGISGGRASVRTTLKNVINSINEDIEEGSYTGLTYNHPETELGYLWDSSRYTLEEARLLIIERYNQQKV